MLNGKRLVTDRFLRVWSIVEFIAQRPGVSRAQLAQEFALSERQLQADLRLIRNGMALPLTRDRGYRFHSPETAANALTLQDLFLLSTLARRTFDDPSLPREATLDALARLALAFPPPLQPLARQALAPPIDSRFGPGPEVFACLAGALVRQQPVRLSYPLPEDRGMVREPVVEPRVLFPYDGSWYLIGRQNGQPHMAMFCLDTLESAAVEA
jgi:predicted DNA-binding transcriptional regulator YafY